MAKPNTLPEWDTTQVNSIEPDAAHKAQGWLAPGGVPEKPPFQTFNHWQNNVYEWLKYFEEIGLPIYNIDSSQADQGATSTNPDTYTVYDAVQSIGSKYAIINVTHDPDDGTDTEYFLIHHYLLQHCLIYL